jgi:hypothetical protein
MSFGDKINYSDAVQVVLNCARCGAGVVSGTEHICKEKENEISEKKETNDGGHNHAEGQP